MSKDQRFIELDLLRAFALSMMIFFHLLWDLDYFGILPLNSDIYAFAKICPIMFFILLGICLHISYDKYKDKIYTHLVKRGIKIFGCGMILTAVSFLIIPAKPILFGVLHCIALCMIFSVLFLRLKYYNILIAPLVIYFGEFISSIRFLNPTYLHLIFGLHTGDLWKASVDYFPIIPWLGYCLLGIFVGNVLYTAEERKFKMPELPDIVPVRIASKLGRHSLFVYLIHQPIIGGGIYIYANHSMIYATIVGFLT